MRWIGTKYSHIGVDLSSRNVKAVQLARTGKGWKLHASVVLPRTDTNSVVGLADALERQGFVMKPIVLSAPVNELHAEVLDLPPIEGEAARLEIARAEMGRVGKFGEDPFEMASWPLPAMARAATGCAVMAVALRHKHADAWIEMFEKAGVEVSTIDLPTCAVARLVGNAGAATGELKAILDLRWDGALLGLTHNGAILYQRLLPDWPASVLHEAIRKHFGVEADVADHILHDQDEANDWVKQLIHSYVDAISDEVNAALAYSRHRYPQLAWDELILAGDGASFTGIEAEFKKKFESAKVRLAKPGAFITGITGELDSPSFATAIGLATHGEAK